MSEPISALGGATFTDGIADISVADPIGMISIRADLSAAFLKKALKKVAGVDIPQMRAIQRNGDKSVVWMSPDELLLVCVYKDVATILAALKNAAGANHMLAVNVSDARAVFRIKGKHVREVLAKLAPVDMAPDAFAPDMVRRTRLAQVAAAFWMVKSDNGEAEMAELVCFRSVAQYVFDLLKVAAQPGSAVGYYHR